MSTSHRVVAAAAMAIVAGAVSAHAPRAAELTGAMKQAIAAANKEGSLRVTWGATTLGGAGGARRIQDGMNKMFGATFAIKYTPSAGSMARVGSKIMAEIKANRKTHTDLYLGPTTFVARFAKAGMYQTVNWHELLPDRMTNDVVEADGKVVRLVSFVAGITYNSRLVKDAPKTVEGWLRPDLKGKIASTTAAAAFDVLAANDFWGAKRTLAFSEKLSRHIAGLIRCGESNRIASGEFWALMFDCGGSDARHAKAKGIPIDRVVPRDFVQLRFFYFGVPNNAENPNAAKVFVAYMMTPEGQNLAWDTWRLDLHSFPGSNMGKEMDALRREGAKPRVLDINWTNSHPETGKARRKILKIFRSARP